jgi:hypothetical protein
MTAHSSAALMNILLQGRKYMDWLPFDRTIDRAKLYMKDGRPFSDLSPADKGMITRIAIIRNAIAHRSDYALIKFQEVIDIQHPLPRERTPAGYLRSLVTPTSNRFDVYAGELKRLTSALS